MPTWLPVALFFAFFFFTAAKVAFRFIRLAHMMQNPEQVPAFLDSPEMQSAFKMSGQDPEVTKILQEALRTSARNGDAKVIHSNGVASLSLGGEELSESTLSALRALQEKRQMEALRPSSGPSSIVRLGLLLVFLGGVAALGWFFAIA
jgi:hypothetical protein